MKLLQITDDGDGIQSSDLMVICGRNCTSKLKNIEDLKEIGTFGFRGEALARFSFCQQFPHFFTRTKKKTDFN